MLVASDDATDGLRQRHTRLDHLLRICKNMGLYSLPFSVMAKALLILPWRSGVSHSAFCAGDAYLASSSMLPVSGAEQF